MIKWLGAGVLAILSAVGVSVLSKEVEGWLDLLPSMLLRLARRRLPPDQRNALYDEWYAELHAALYGSENTPLTRLWLGVRFAAGLVLAARRVARELGEARISGIEAVDRPREGLKIARLRLMNLRLVRVSPSHAGCDDPAIFAIRHPGTPRTLLRSVCEPHQPDERSGLD